MKAELIAVGTELLLGQILNTNAKYLSEQLASRGIDVYFQTVVGDNAKRLKSVLTIAKNRSDLIILCGGLGPTPDDLTKQTVAEFLGRGLAVDQAALKKIDRFFAHRPDVDRTPNNDRQAQIIEGSVALPNETGLAVGSLVSDGGVTYALLPGPPSELVPMVATELLPRLTSETILYSRVLHFFGIGESRLVTLLKDVIEHQTDPTIAPYAKVGEVTLRLSTKAATREEAERKLDEVERTILAHQDLSDYYYGEGEDLSLEKAVVSLLKEKNLSLTAAESLTAGLFQASLARVSGVSEVFRGGFVTYSLEEKAKMLGLDLLALEKNGVVSPETAEQMAEGARLKVGADLAISLTGVAGPDKLENQEVGTVYIALASSQGTHVKRLTLGPRDRETIRQLSVLHALNLIRQTLLTL